MTPLTIDELTAIAATPGGGLERALARALGTPVATPAPPTGGEPAAPTVVAAVTATSNEFAACVNAGDFLRVLALVTETTRIRIFGGLLGDPTALTMLATPTPLPPEQQVRSVTVTDVRELPDGRVSALVTVNDDPARIVFAKVGDRYLIDENFPLNAVAPEVGTPTP